MTRITTGQMAQMLVQALSGGKDTGNSFELKVGSIVRATLLSSLVNDQFWLQIGNTKLRAALDANLQPGDQVHLLVTGEQVRGALELKVVGQPVRETEAKPQLEPEALLRALKMPVNEETKALVSEFLGRQLPLKPDVLRAAADVLRQVQASTGQPPTPEHVATLGKMAELGIPIQQSAFEALHALDNGPKLHDLLGRLIQNVKAVLPEQDAPTTSAVNQPAQTPETPTTPPSQAQPATTPAPSTTAKTVTTQPQHVPNAPSTQPAEDSGDPFPENKISRPDATPADQSRVPAEPQSQPQRPQQQQQPLLSETTRNRLTELVEVAKKMLAETDASPEGLGEQAKRLGLGFEERVAHALRRLPPGSDRETVRAAFQQAVQVDPNKQAPGLKQALLLAQATAPELEAAGMHQLAQDVSMLLSQVTGQQVMQTAGQERSDLFYQFAAVPMQVGGQQQTVELHVMSRKGPGQKQMDPANCYILFRLDMPNLGPLDIHLHIVDKVVGLRFQTEAGHELVIDPGEQRDLREALQQTGFHLGVLKVEEKKPPEESAHLPLLPPILTQGALDLKL